MNRCAVILPAAFALECVGAWLLNGSVLAGGTIHLGVSAALALWCWRLHRSGGELRVPLLAAVMTPAAGPFGAGGALMVLALGLWFNRSAVNFEDWYASLFPEDQPVSDAAVMEMVRAIADRPAGHSSVGPLLDVLSFGSYAQKQSAIALVSRSWQPRFAPVLLAALRDPANAVRVQAATAIAKVEAGFMAGSIELKRALDQQPDDRERLLAIARHYDDYAFSGILDAERERENRDEAIRYYRQLLAADPGCGDARLAVGRLLFRLARYAEAGEWLSAVAGTEAVIWRMESLFQLGRFEELRALAGRHGPELAAAADLPLPLREALWMWLGEAAGSEDLAA